jgi:hypothetical protein
MRVSSSSTRASRVSPLGRGEPTGGIIPVRSLAIMRSATSARANGDPTSKPPSVRLPRFIVSLWHRPQYCFTTPLSAAGAMRAVECARRGNTACVAPAARSDAAGRRSGRVTGREGGRTAGGTTAGAVTAARSVGRTSPGAGDSRATDSVTASADIVFMPYLGYVKPRRTSRRNAQQGEGASARDDWQAKRRRHHRRRLLRACFGNTATAGLRI